MSSFVPYDSAESVGEEFPHNWMSNNITWALWARTPTGQSPSVRNGKNQLDWSHAVIEHNACSEGEQSQPEAVKRTIFDLERMRPDQDSDEDVVHTLQTACIEMHKHEETLSRNETPSLPSGGDDAQEHSPQLTPMDNSPLGKKKWWSRAMSKPLLERYDTFGEREARALDDFNTSWVDGLLNDEASGSGRTNVSATSNNLRWGRWIMQVGTEQRAALGRFPKKQTPVGTPPRQERSSSTSGALGRLWGILGEADLTGHLEMEGGKSVADCVGKEGKGSILIPMSPPVGPGAYVSILYLCHSLDALSLCFRTPIS